VVSELLPAEIALEVNKISNKVINILLIIIKISPFGLRVLT